MYMKYNTCLNSSVDTILFVFADHFTKLTILQSKQTRNRLPLCGRLNYYYSCEFRGSTTRLGD